MTLIEPYAPVLITLLKGIIYSDENREIWKSLKQYEIPIRAYFAKMGLQLYVSDEGFAYLSQPSDDEQDGDDIYKLPRLTTRRALTYTVTLLCVLLRERLRLFEADEPDSDQYILTQEQLYDLMERLWPERGDEKARIKKMNEDIQKVVALGFLRESEVLGEKRYELRRILKHLINADKLSEIRDKLAKYRSTGADEGETETS
ncbi:MAG: DUF4194 domain-containing protein [Anaerolineae bacterium]|jgi:hypothetical protein|nr:DUF4194 domain-containing protein [Anaerolineae bacterium]